MPVQPSEVQWYLSAPNAGGGFLMNGYPGASLGKYMSVDQVSYSAPLNDLFEDISAVENSAMQVDYQCVFIKNSNAGGFYMNQPFISLPSAYWTAGGADIAIGIDPTGISVYNSSSPQAVVIPNSATAPAGVTFVTGPMVQYTSGIPFTGLPPGYVQAIWLRRTATGSPQLTPQLFNLTCTYISNA